MTHRMFRAFLAAVVLVSVMNLPALLPTPARAAMLTQAETTVIDFDDVKIPQEKTETALLTDNYLEQGVTFNDPVVVSYRDRDPVPPDFAHSGEQAMHQCESSEQWCDDPVIMTFTEPQSQVGAWIGYFGSLSEDKKVTMTAFDAVTGGNVVDAAALWMFATEAGSIPADFLGVSASSPVIRRVEVGFPDGTLLASHLIFDDVMFTPEPPGPVVGTGDGEPCPPGTAVPTVRLGQLRNALVVSENRFILNGKVTTSQDLLEATLTRVNDGHPRTETLLPRTLSAAGGAIGPVAIKGFLAPGENMLTLNVRNCAGPASVQTKVTYEPTAEGTHYTLEALEVTQTIQDPANSVRLVAGKRTFVRVFLTTAGSTDTLSNVRAGLSACPVAGPTAASCEDDVQVLGPLQSLNAVTVDALSGSDNLVAKRGSMQAGLLFELPLAWTEVDYLRLWVKSSDLSPELRCDGCDIAGARIVRFEDGPSLTVDLVDVSYTIDGVTYTPDEIHRGYLLSWLARAYPTNDIREVTDMNLVTFAGRPTCYDVAQAMFAEWVLKTYGAKTPAGTPYAMTLTRYYGLVAAQGESDRDPMRGCALLGTHGTDDERLDNEHFASGQAGSGLAWPWDHDGSYADWYGGHEIAHTFERTHLGRCRNPGGVDDRFPLGNDGYLDLTSDGQRIDYIGFDSGNADLGIPRSVYRADKWHDVMTYCKYQWMSAYTYNALWTQMEAEDAAVPAEEPGEVPTAEFPDDVDDVGAVTTPEPAQPVLLVVGTVNKDKSTVAFRPLAVLPDGSPTKRDDRGEFRIVLRNGNEAILATYPFEPLPYSDQAVGADEIAQLSEIVPWVDGTDFIDIERGTPGVRIARQVVSAHAPTVQLTGPIGGGPLPGGVAPVTWDGRDPDGDTLTYSLHYSVNNGATWQSMVSGLSDEHFDVDLSRVSGSNQILFRVIATDGVRTALAQSDVSFTVSPHAPEASIISPGDRSRYDTSQTIVLVGEARDAASGKLPDRALTWTADGEGSSGLVLGSGRSIAVSDLPPGRYTITLTATGKAGLTAEASIRIRIETDEPEELDWSHGPISDIASNSLGPDGLFLYDNAEEAGAFYAGDGAGNLSPLRTFDVLLNGWSAVIPGNFGGDDSTDLLFYAAELGVGEFYASDGAGGLSLLSGNEGFTRGWDLIVPVDLRSADEWTSLLFYDRQEGVGKLYTTDGTGKIALVGTPIPLGHTWSAIVTGQFAEGDHKSLLLYDKETGRAQLASISAEGQVELLGESATWDPGWDVVVPGDFGSAHRGADLFLYDVETGRAAVITSDGTGELAQPRDVMTFEPHWDAVVVGNFGGQDTAGDFFFYDAAQGLGTFYTMTDQGELQERGSVSDLALGWDQIVSGRFGSP